MLPGNYQRGPTIPISTQLVSSHLLLLFIHSCETAGLSSISFPDAILFYKATCIVICASATQSSLREVSGSSYGASSRVSASWQGTGVYLGVRPKSMVQRARIIPSSSLTSLQQVQWARKQPERQQPSIEDNAYTDLAAFFRCLRFPAQRMPMCLVGDISVTISMPIAPELGRLYCPNPKPRARRNSSIDCFTRSSSGR